MTNVDIKLVRNAAKKHDEVKASNADSNTNLRLIKLCDQYGVEVVSAATGLQISSIVQYSTRKTAPQIKEETISKAEHVLSQF